MGDCTGNSDCGLNRPEGRSWFAKPPTNDRYLPFRPTWRTASPVRLCAAQRHRTPRTTDDRTSPTATATRNGQHAIGAPDRFRFAFSRSLPASHTGRKVALSRVRLSMSKSFAIDRVRECRTGKCRPFQAAVAAMYLTENPIGRLFLDLLSADALGLHQGRRWSKQPPRGSSAGLRWRWRL